MIVNMATYESRKTVQAAKITAIAQNDQGGFRIEYLDKDYRPAWTNLPWTWHDKHRPQVGWYLVQYKDGYLSASPAAPFEEASTRIEE